MHHVFDVVLISNKVDAHQAGVTVAGVEGLEAVAQVGLHRQASQAAAQVLNVGRRGNMGLMANAQKTLSLYSCTHLNSDGKGLFFSTEVRPLTHVCREDLYPSLMATKEINVLQWAKLQGKMLN